VRFLRGCLIFMALDLLFLLALAGAAAYFLTRPPASVRDLPPPATSPEKALALENKLNEFSRELEEASTARERKHFSVVITEEEANSLITRELPRFQEQNPEAIPFRVDSAQVSFREGTVLATAVIGLGGLHPQVAVEAQLGAQGGQPTVDFERIELGRLPLPLLGPLQNYVRQALGAPEAFDLSLEVEQLEVAEGKLTLEGWSKPGSLKTVSQPPVCLSSVPYS
jgi:uncharacterized protein YpmS